MSEKYVKQHNWNINLPNDRCFKNEEVIINPETGECYSIDELINILNHDLSEKEQVIQLINEDIKSANEDLKRCEASNKEGIAYFKGKQAALKFLKTTIEVKVH